MDYYTSKYASIIYRMGQPYFDAELNAYGIGCGQQFFLLRIYENPGISQLELASGGHYDQGTTARAVKKLEEKQYIRREVDSADKRFYKLYSTDKATAVIQSTLKALEKWHEILLQDLSETEKQTAEKLMEKMAENAYAYASSRVAHTMQDQTKN